MEASSNDGTVFFRAVVTLHFPFSSCEGARSKVEQNMFIFRERVGNLGIYRSTCMPRTLKSDIILAFLSRRFQPFSKKRVNHVGVDGYFRTKDKKVVMLVDNCSVHKIDAFVIVWSLFVSFSYLPTSPQLTSNVMPA